MLTVKNPIVSDQFPYTEAPFPELGAVVDNDIYASQQELSSLASVTRLLINTSPTETYLNHDGSLQTTSADLMLADGYIIPKVIEGRAEDGSFEPYGTAVALHLLNPANNNVTRSFALEVYCSADQIAQWRAYKAKTSKNGFLPERMANFSQGADLIDEGIVTPGSDLADDLFMTMLMSRSGEAPEKLPIIPGTMTEDIASAELLSKAGAISRELLSDKTLAPGLEKIAKSRESRLLRGTASSDTVTKMTRLLANALVSF